MRFTRIISPFLAWARAIQRSDTVPFPRTSRPGTQRYRGFHINDSERCIGCGRCADICQNAAIDMVETDKTACVEGDSGLRPRIDYGRCCWCALCVDVCSTGSLGMSNRYLWSSKNPDDFIYTPGIEETSWDEDIEGYRQDAELLGWAGSPRMPMPMLESAERIRSFDEVIAGYIEDDAVREAERCIQCGLCVAACPAHMHIPDYLQAIAERRFVDAVEIFYANNPLPELCGKVCTRRCETVCALGHQGEPIAIRWLKRFATERFESLVDIVQRFERGQPTGKSVAIIGAGPAGLTTAFYLSLAGHDVTVFDAAVDGGGVTRSGIPRYRLPSESLDKQMAVFNDLGIRFKYETVVDSERFNRIRFEHHAVFLGVGLTGSMGLRIKGEDHERVTSALDFLRRVNVAGDHSPIGESVVVVGGGNVAMDASRVARRLGSEVILSYRRRIEDMPADNEEIEEAMDEGIDFRPQTIPLRIDSSGTRISYVYGDAEMISDPRGGRPRPRLIEGSEHTLVVDRVLIAIGQSPDLGLVPLDVGEKLRVEWGKILVDEDQYTGVENIYAGGDITPGRGDAISAIADGLRAARGINARLEGRST